jgi:hypothetical protein
MPIETYDSADAVPEEHRDTALALADGKFAVVKEAPAEDVAGLKKKNGELLGDLKKLKQQIEAEAQKRAEAELATKGLLEHKQRWDSEILTPVKSRLETLEAENRQLKLVGPVKDALHKAGAIDPEAVWQLEADRFDLDETGRPYVKDDPTADIGKWVATALPKSRPYLFRGTEAGGGGARGGAGGTGGAATGDPRGWTATERAEYIAANGVSAFRSVMAKAIVKKP